MSTTAHAVAIPAGDIVLFGGLAVPESAWRRRVRARQRLEPAEPPQPLRRGAARRGGPRDAALRPPHRGRGEADVRANIFDITLLTGRLLAVTGWLRGQPEATGAPLGYFGASTGAAAALRAASESEPPVAAVVSRGGRPDLVARSPPGVHAPTLLIVGGDDTAVLSLNEVVAPSLAGRWKVAVVPGATHLFEEPGALEEVSRLAAAWFVESFERSRDAKGAGR